MLSSLMWRLTVSGLCLGLAISSAEAQLWPQSQPSFPGFPQQQQPQAAPPIKRRPRPAFRVIVPKAEAPKAAAQPAAPAADEPPPPYEPSLLRLAEILGALSYLRDVCGAPDADAWRARMQALLDAEAKSASRKEYLAGAFNRGFHGYEISYRSCTPSAKLIIKRFLAEGEKIAHDVANRYGAS